MVWENEIKQMIKIDDNNLLLLNWKILLLLIMEAGKIIGILSMLNINNSERILLLWN